MALSLEPNYKEKVRNDLDKDDVQINQMEVLQLKDNVIPKCLIPLEELFDHDDVARKPTL